MKRIQSNWEPFSIHSLQKISGNIHCLADPGEVVIGFIEVTQEQVKRIFISNSQVPGWNYDPGCVETSLIIIWTVLPSMEAICIPPCPVVLILLVVLLNFTRHLIRIV
jgi:hypothetical protein